MRQEPIFPMTVEEDYQATMAALKRPRTKEEALQNFIEAGILDENGNLTEPYKEQQSWIRQKAD